MRMFRKNIVSIFSHSQCCKEKKKLFAYNVCQNRGGGG